MKNLSGEVIQVFTLPATREVVLTSWARGMSERVKSIKSNKI